MGPPGHPQRGCSSSFCLQDFEQASPDLSLFSGTGWVLQEDLIAPGLSERSQVSERALWAQHGEWLLDLHQLLQVPAFLSQNSHCIQQAQALTLPGSRLLLVPFWGWGQRYWDLMGWTEGGPHSACFLPSKVVAPNSRTPFQPQSCEGEAVPPWCPGMCLSSGVPHRPGEEVCSWRGCP